MYIKKSVFLLIAIFTATSVFAFDIPSDEKYSPARDHKILNILTNAKNMNPDFIEITKLSFKKLSGYRVGGGLRYDEQWSYIIEIQNINTSPVDCGMLYLNVYDLSGFLRDKFMIIAGDLQPSETKNKSNYFYVKLSYINEINSADITFGCYK